MPASTARKRTTEAGRPAARTLSAKSPAKAKAAKRAPARSTKDWKDEEANETDSKSYRGKAGGPVTTPEEAVAGDNYHIANWSHPDWQDDEDNRLTVSLWFPTQRVALDYPEDEAERDTKIAVFKKLKVPYVGVLPGQPLKVDEARKQLLAQGAKIAH
jgi:hypothetical protein